jgi:hypothetical protein
MQYTPSKISAIVFVAVLLLVFAMPFAHAIPIEMDTSSIKIDASTAKAEPELVHLLGDDEGYGGSMGANTHVSVHCAVGRDGSCFNGSNPVSVPEPGTLLMFATGMILLALSSRRRRILTRA